MVWGVRSIHSPTIEGDSMEDRVMSAICYANAIGILKINEQVICVSSSLRNGTKKQLLTLVEWGSWMGIFSVEKVVNGKK